MSVPSQPASGTVEVLLAVKNGARFLAQQLDSLIAQTISDFTIVVSDDGSTDGTAAILEDYNLRHPGRFRFLEAADRALGASGNFARLLDAAQADLVFFCDQDDVWLPNKMAMTLTKLRELEHAHPPGTPLLVHTDLCVVDAELNVLGQSFFRYSGVRPDRNSLSSLLLGNIATGCTVLVNRPLYEIARPVPEEALMYDHWLAQIAASLGAIACLPEPTVLYRQHGRNTIGADRAGSTSIARRAARILFSDKTLRVLTSYSRHAALLLERCGCRMSSVDRRLAESMAQLWELPPWRRHAHLRRVGLQKATFVANVGLALLVLRTGKPVRNPVNH